MTYVPTLKKYRYAILASALLVSVGVIILILSRASSNDGWVPADNVLARFSNRIYTINGWTLQNGELVVDGPNVVTILDLNDYTGIVVTSDDEFAADAIWHRLLMQSRTPVIFNSPRGFSIIEIRNDDGIRVAKVRMVRASAIRYRPW